MPMSPDIDTGLSLVWDIRQGRYSYLFLTLCLSFIDFIFNYIHSLIFYTFTFTKSIFLYFPPTKYR